MTKTNIDELDDKTWNHALRDARRANKMSAIALASAAGTTEQRIYSFERRRFKPCQYEAVLIASALKLPVEILFPGKLKL